MARTVTAKKKIKVWTPERKAAAIGRLLEGIAGGRSVASLMASDKRLPSFPTWYEWLKEDEGLAKNYACALEARADITFDRLADLAGQVREGEIDPQAAKVPAVKLLGISPSGFNATGESDLRNHYDHVAGQQEKILRPGLETALKVIQLNRLGGISPDIGFTFNPLSKDDEQVQANIRKTRADTAAVYVQAGVVAPDEVRAALVQDPDSGFDNLRLEDNAAELEAELAKIFGPGAGGPRPQGPADDGPARGTMAEAEAMDDWSEEDHPRDEDGQFGSGGGGSGGEARTTSQEEKQKKIDSVKIDFDQDNTLPGLNAEDLAALGKEDRPVVLKQSIIERNFEKHPDISKEEYNALIGQALYNHDAIVPSNKPEKPNYYNFVKYLERDNSVVLLEMSPGKDNHEIVHIVKMNDRGVGRL